MAFNQISIDTSKQWGNQARRYRNLLLEVRNLGREILGKSTSTVDGSDYSQLENQFGIATGKGESFYNELNSLVAKFETDSEVTNVKAAIEQFCNYVG